MRFIRHSALLLLSAVLLNLAVPRLRAQTNGSGQLTVGSINLGSYTTQFDGTTETIQYNSPALVLPIGSIQGGNLAWSQSGNWNNADLLLVNGFAELSDVFEGGSGFSLSATYQEAVNSEYQGPTQRVIQTPLQISAHGVSANANLVIGFDVTIPNGSEVIMDQPGVVLNSLTVNSGGNLSARTDLTVGSDGFYNYGLVSNLGGSVAGDFINGDPQNGPNAFAQIAGTLTIQGRFINSAEIAIGEGGSLNLSSKEKTNFNDGTMLLGGGSISGNLVNAGDFVWASGFINGSFTNYVGHNFTVIGTDAKAITTGLFTNLGTVTQQAGATVTLAGGVLNNATGSLYDVQGDGIAFTTGNDFSFQNNAVNNSGTFRKSGGSGEADIGNGVTFNNTGTVEVDSGTVALINARGSNDGGNYVFSNGGVFEIGNGSGFTLDGTLSATGNGAFQVGPANVRVSSGSSAQVINFTNGANLLINGGGDLGADAGASLFLNLTGSSAVLLQSGGVGGDGSNVNAGNFVWSGGFINGSFTNSGNAFVIAGKGGGQAISGDTTLTNSGTITQNAGATLTMNGSGQQAAVLNNLVGATYNVQGDGTIITTSVPFYYGPNNVVNNAGTFLKSGGKGEAAITYGVSFNNTGTVEIDSGTLAFSGGFDQTSGTTELKGGGISGQLLVQGGRFGGEGTVTGELLVSNATINVGASPDALVIDGAYNQAGGSLVFEIDPNGLGGFLNSTLVFDPSDSVGITDTSVTFDFLNGADPTTFFGDGLFNLNNFFTVNNGDSFGTDFNLGDIFHDDTFLLNEPGWSISGFDAHTGALDFAQTSNTVPDAVSTSVLLMLALAPLAALRCRPKRG